jgi:hypothetical protein
MPASATDSVWKLIVSEDILKFVTALFMPSMDCFFL